jgi:hypothetical protein
MYTNICSNKIKQNHKILAPAQNISEYIKYWRPTKLLADAQNIGVCLKSWRLMKI